MSLNFTNIDDFVIFIINPIVSVSFFVLLVLPTLVLIILCVLALLFANAINVSIRILLLNIFATELTQLLGPLVLFLGHPARVHDVESINYSCNFVFSAIFSGAFAKLPSTSLYAVVVYVYIKHGVKWLKWYVPPLFITLIWTISFVLGILPYLNVFDVVSNRGTCRILSSTSAPIIISIAFGAVYAVSICFTVVFGILTFCYVKKNALSQAIDKAITKLLLYQIIGIFVTLLNNVLPTVLDTLSIHVFGFTSPLALYYVSNAIIVLPAMVTPVSTMFLLKPVQSNIRFIFTCKLATSRVEPMELEPALNPDSTVHQEQAIDPRPESTLNSDSTVHQEQAIDPRPESTLNPDTVHQEQDIDPRPEPIPNPDSTMHQEQAIENHDFQVSEDPSAGK